MQNTINTYEAEIAPGLEHIALTELQALPINNAKIGNGFITFAYTGNTDALRQLKTVNSIYLVQTFDVPRPKALLGHQHFTRLLQAIQRVQSLYPQGAFQTLHIDAAGAESSVMRRLKDELATAAGLTPAEDKGDLQLRLKRAQTTNGWDALIRLSPRPLATRKWRINNFEGALNATVAHAMVKLTQPAPADIFLNVCVGSGTLLIERATYDAKTLIGCDIDPYPLSLAKEHITTASTTANLLQSDAVQLPFAAASINKLCADLPFGQLVGSHQQNKILYPALLSEAARIATHDAIFVLITHEIRLIETLLKHQRQWRTLQTLKITLNGLHPRIYVLSRT